MVLNDGSLTQQEPLSVEIAGIAAGAIGVKATLIDVTMALDTNVYADGDVLTATAEIPNAVLNNGGAGIIHSLALLDKDDQAGALDIVFMRTNKSLGTVNDPVSISAADAAEILGIVSITAAEYKDLVNSQFVSVGIVGLVFEAGAGSTSFFVSMISRDAKTYTAAGLILKLGIAQD